MTIKEIQKLKYELENEISEKLNEFEEKTNTYINNINIFKTNFHTISDKIMLQQKIRIDLDVKL